MLEQDFDMIVLPGGLPGADYLNDDKRIQQLLKKMQQQEKYIAAICAAPKVLANAGLLENKSATSYPGVLDKMSGFNLKFVDMPVVQDGNIITSKGPGTAIDFTLSLIEILLNKKTRNQIEASLVRP